MGCGFAHLNQKVWICLLSVFVTVSVLVCSTAGADVYDDFSNENIDTTKWTIRSTPGGALGLFIQSKGRLHFFGKRDAGESLVSSKSFPAGFFRIEFYGFYSTNDAPSGRGMGSFVALGLGPRDNYVRML